MAGYCGNAFSGLMDKIHRSQNADSGGLSMERFFLRLQRMLKKKSRIYWNNWYFTKYIEEGVSPWGLGIQIFPNLNKIEPDFKSNWEDDLQAFSIQMMNLLCQQYSLELYALDRETEKLYQANENLISDSLFNSQEQTLKNDFREFHCWNFKNERKKVYV